MTSNSNLGYTGYLLRKTIQPFSLRKDNSNFNEFREKNMIMYINKKVSNTREREGPSLAHQQLQKGIHILVRNAKNNGGKGDEEASQQYQQEEVNLEQLKKDEEKERKDPFYREVVIQMKQNEFTDDFAVVSEENKIGKQAKSKKERSNIEQTLNILVANNLEQNMVQDLFRDYKKLSLKDKLNDLKSRHADMAKIQRKIKKDQQKMQNLEDTEKVNKIMGSLCQNKNITLGKILQMKEEEIQYSEQQDGVDGIPRGKALEMLEELMEDQEEENQKNLIKIFKKTQLDNIDSDVAKNKLNMTSFKKKNEQTEKLYNQMAQNNKKALLNAWAKLLLKIKLKNIYQNQKPKVKDPFIDPDKFVRKKEGVKAPNEKVNVFQRLVSSEYAKNQEIQQQRIPKLIPLGTVQSEQEKYHHSIKQIYERNKSYDSTSHMYYSQEFKKSQINTQDSYSNNQQIFLTQSNNSVPTSTANHHAYAKSSIKNYTGNSSSLLTPQKAQDISQMSTEQKTAQTKKLGLHRVNSAKQVHIQNQSHSDLPYQRQISNYHSPQLTKSISSFNFKPQGQPQSNKLQTDILKQRIAQLQDDKQYLKAKKIQMLVDKMEMSAVVQNFVTNCNNEKQESNKNTAATKGLIKQLEDEFEDDLKEINLLEQGQVNVEVKIDNPNFNEFKMRAEFKRKLINYIIHKVEKKTDVLSKYKSKQFINNFLQKLNDKD